MANFIVVQLIFLLFIEAGFAKVDRLHTEAYLGEKNLDSYSDRYQPLIFQDIYQGKMTFQDELFFQEYFQKYAFDGEREMSSFLRSELTGGMTCSNDDLIGNFDTLRYSYRLITLSYLLEAQWHMKMVSDQTKLKDGCQFDLEKWAGTCRPQSEEMKKYISRLIKYKPKYVDTLPKNYKKEEWWKEYSSGKLQSYSQYKMSSVCTTAKCIQDDMAPKFKYICADNEKLMNLICSEQDELYGMSGFRDAYQLIGFSNIINTYNKRGEALGCLRRFSEVMAHKEVKYQGLKVLFPVLQSHLREKYKERWIQGRTFFYGASKEFEDKGLADFFVEEQKLIVAAIPPSTDEVPVAKPVAPKVDSIRPEPVKVVEVQPKKKGIVEISAPVKSAFLLASEIRVQSNLPKVEVDMLKLKYDYVFTLNMMNVLSERLKTFMTREALTEMMTYDKLGTIDGPVPLLFLKFLIDMQEHQGLWNIISVLGDKFYVSNEIDTHYNAGPEYIQIVNNESTGRQWQIFVLRP